MIVVGWFKSDRKHPATKNHLIDSVTYTPLCNRPIANAKERFMSADILGVLSTVIDCHDCYRLTRCSSDLQLPREI